MTRSILTIEDDPAIRRGLVDALRFAGYAVQEAADGGAGCTLALRGSFDLVLLDLVLPGRDGLSILREIRAAHPTQPVIILSAKGQEQDRVAGLQQGADDYLVKPFGVQELLARVEAVLRRSPARPQPLAQIDFAGGCADLLRREVRRADGARCELSERETELLVYLAGHRGRAIAREELLAHVWRLDPRGLSTRTVDMLVARLREKLGDDAESPRVVVTVRGCGYMLATVESSATPVERT